MFYRFVGVPTSPCILRLRCRSCCCRLDRLGPAADPRHISNRSLNPLINGAICAQHSLKLCNMMQQCMYSNLSMLVPCLWLGVNYRNPIVEVQKFEIPAMFRHSCFKTKVPK